MNGNNLQRFYKQHLEDRHSSTDSFVPLLRKNKCLWIFLSTKIELHFFLPGVGIPSSLWRTTPHVSVINLVTGTLVTSHRTRSTFTHGDKSETFVAITEDQTN